MAPATQASQSTSSSARCWPSASTAGRWVGRSARPPQRNRPKRAKPSCGGRALWVCLRSPSCVRGRRLRAIVRGFLDRPLRLPAIIRPARLVGSALRLFPRSPAPATCPVHVRLDLVVSHCASPASPVRARHSSCRRGSRTESPEASSRVKCPLPAARPVPLRSDIKPPPGTNLATSPRMNSIRVLEESQLLPMDEAPDLNPLATVCEERAWLRPDRDGRSRRSAPGTRRSGPGPGRTRRAGGRPDPTRSRRRH